MFVTELEIFGHSAHQDLDTHAGKALVGPHVQLGYAPGLNYHQLCPPPFQIVHKRKTVIVVSVAVKEGQLLANAEEVVD